MSAYPEGFGQWPEDKRNDYFAAEAKEYRAKQNPYYAEHVALRLETPDNVVPLDRDRKPRKEPPPPPVYKPTPFKWRDPKKMPRRQFVYGKHLIRGYLSATVAPGGVGKSSLALVEAVAMATGKALLGIATKPRRVWYVNLEDPREEIERRIAAICLHFDIQPDDLDDRLYFDGREIEIVLATQNKSGYAIAAPAVDALTAALKDGQFDAFVVDPFVSTHRVSENDNMAIDAVAKKLGSIAGAANCAIELIHHVRKTGGQEVTVEDGRGASALVNATRSSRVLNRMSKDEADKAGVGEERGYYFRADNGGKANLVPPATKATWYRLENVALGNGSGEGIDDQDYVGVVTSWKWPDAFEGFTVADTDRVLAAVSEGEWRKDVRSENWVGHAVAAALGLDVRKDAARIKGMIAQWFANRSLVVETRNDEQRRPRAYVILGPSE
jgi:AAA domain-containing protein